MNIFNKVTIESLKKNRTRTIVTIIGIMLSTALICAVTTSVSSVIQFGRNYFAYESGSWHGQIDYQPYDSFEYIESSDKVDKAVFSKYEGYAPIESENEYKPYLYLMGVSDGYDEIMPVHMIDGHFPENDSEILIPSHLSDNGGVYLKTGDKITLEVGERIRDDHAVGQSNPMFEVGADYNEDGTISEDFSVRTTKEYTVCGIYERPGYMIEDSEAPGYTCIVRATDSEYLPETYSISFSMKNAEQIYDFMESERIDGRTNSDLLMFYGISRYNSIEQTLYGLAAVVIVLIMFGSVMLIYNAFSISVAERTKQFGLLSSIGATKKQLRKMVRFESFVVSGIGIPLGILLGIAGMWVTFTCLGSKFGSFFGEDLPDEVKMKLSVSVVSIIAAVVIAIVTISISAWIPSKRATKVTAVEAIRMSSDIKVKNKKLKTPKLVYKLFGFSGMLGHKYYKRSKKRYRTTIMSLFMSIVLFVSASAFTDYLIKGAEISSETSGYDLVYHYSGDDMINSAPELLEKIKNVESVDNASFAFNTGVNCDVEKSVINPELLGMLEMDMAMSGGIVNPDSSKINMYVVSSFVDEETYQRLLDENGLSKAKFMSAESPLGILYDGDEIFDREAGRFVKSSSIIAEECSFDCHMYESFKDYWFYMDNGDGTATYMNYNDEEKIIPNEDCRTNFTLRTGKTIHNKPFYNSSTGIILAVYPFSMMEDLMPKEDNDYCEIFINSAEPEECEKELTAFLKDNHLHTDSLHNVAEAEKQERSFITIVKVFAYGFIVLISLIAAANVFNTISTNIGLRRREFAMLRSVGMTQKGIRNILNYECILYGLKSLAAGLPVAGVVVWFIFRSVDISMDVDFYLPWEAIGIAVFSVFAVVFATMMYSMSKLKNDNTIDALKNENL